jgi:hypothetical protein
MEAACARALAIESPSRKSVETILKRGLDRVAVESETTPGNARAHANVRGGAYYDTEKATQTKTVH